MLRLLLLPLLISVYLSVSSEVICSPFPCRGEASSHLGALYLGAGWRKGGMKEALWAESKGKKLRSEQSICCIVVLFQSSPPPGHLPLSLLLSLVPFHEQKAFFPLDGTDRWMDGTNDGIFFFILFGFLVSPFLLLYPLSCMQSQVRWCSVIENFDLNNSTKQSKTELMLTGCQANTNQMHFGFQTGFLKI